MSKDNIRREGHDSTDKRVMNGEKKKKRANTANKFQRFEPSFSDRDSSV